MYLTFEFDNSTSNLCVHLNPILSLTLFPHQTTKKGHTDQICLTIFCLTYVQACSLLEAPDHNPAFGGTELQKDDPWLAGKALQWRISPVNVSGSALERLSFLLVLVGKNKDLMLIVSLFFKNLKLFSAIIARIT